MSELQRYLDAAQEIAWEAGRLTLGWFNRGVEVIDKADGSPVTVADRDAETLVRRAIEARFPDHGIRGEEHGPKEARAGCSYTWYIDPIDGTKSFVHGVPLYSNLLALVRDGKPVVGIIQLPALGEQLAAAEGLGCRLNGRPVRVSQIADLSRAVVLTSDSRDLGISAPTPGWRPLWEGCRFPRSWGDGYGYYLVATGRAEVMLDARAADYDLAPMPVILREAGGAFFDWRGEETFLGGHGAACNAALAEQVRASLRG